MDALPADVRQELVMAAAAIDGHAVTTHRFRSAAPPGLLADTLRERWRAEGRSRPRTMRAREGLALRAPSTTARSPAPGEAALARCCRSNAIGETFPSEECRRCGL